MIKDGENKSENTYITVREASERWKIPQMRIAKLCEDGMIDGVAKLGDQWIIPSNSDKPIFEKATTLVRPVIAKNNIQRVAIEHIEKGNDFHVSETVIRGATYIVSGVFQKQGATVEEKVARCIAQELDASGKMKISVADSNKLMKEIRATSSANAVTFESYMAHYKKLFQEYGFTDEDIEVLLERKALDYEEFEL